MFCKYLCGSFAKEPQFVGIFRPLIIVSGAGGVREACAQVSGDNVFANMKFESGVHRVQRVPVTEVCEFGCVLQCVAVCCSVLQCVAVCCSVLQCARCHMHRMPVTEVCVFCSVLPCVAVCCSVF